MPRGQKQTVGGVRVAEYLGQRTDVDSPVITPAVPGDLCPFMNSACTKISRGQAPVCSVRRSDGTLWITCEHRLCATLQKPPLSAYQKARLLEFARILFDPSMTPNRVMVKREARVAVHDETDDYKGNSYKADYIMTIDDGQSPYPGPDRLVLEMQGGGETSNTKKITRHVEQWAKNESRTNDVLCKQIQGTHTLETNAWRRQQEQFIVKGNVAMQTWKGYGIAFFVGSLLYDYVLRKLPKSHLPNLRSHNWTLAFIGVSEDVTSEINAGSIPLEIDSSRMLFTNYQTFVQALINQGEPSPNAFGGQFDCLDGSTSIIPVDGR